MDVFTESVSENVVQNVGESVIGKNFLPTGVIHTRSHIIVNSRNAAEMRNM